MMKSLPLRWHLSIRFAGVTILTFLLVMLFVVGFLFYQILITNWELSPSEWLKVAERTAVPTTRKIILQAKDNQGMIDMWLSYVASPVSTFPLLRYGDIEIVMRTVSSAEAFLMDGEGLILGCSVPDRYGKLIGTQFKPELLPEIAETVSVALQGTQNPKLLVRSIDDESTKFSIAVPIFESDEIGASLIGVLAVVFDTRSAPPRVVRHTLGFAILATLSIMIFAAFFAVFFAFITAKALTSRISNFSSISDRWSQGDFSRYIEDVHDDEIGILARRLDNMARETQDLIGQRERIATEEERNRLARDLHDSVKQLSLAASFQIGAALTVIDSDTQKAELHAREAEVLLDEVRLELNSLIDGSLRHNLISGEFETIIIEYVDRWSARENIHVMTNIAELPELDRNLFMDVFRIIQESLSNIARHSRAEHVDIIVTYSNEKLLLILGDDGIGFDDTSGSGVGLMSIQKRVEKWRGSYVLESIEAPGTRISIEIPLGGTE